MSNKETSKTLTQHAYEICKNRFDSTIAAKIYNTRHLVSRKGKREMHCIQRALSDVQKNSLILDLPCGTGRLSYYIRGLGFKVLGADYSTHMLEHAKKQDDCILKNTQGESISFEQQDIIEIKHQNNTFMATVCNRLFHHFPTPELRRAALKELARVTKGPIIISFFNSYSLSALWTKIKNIVKNKTPTDRMAISFYVFKKDIESCGLKIHSTYYTSYGFSPQMYVKVVKEKK